LSQTAKKTEDVRITPEWMPGCGANHVRPRAEYAPNTETLAALREIEDMRTGRIPKQSSSIANFVKEMGE
jgi:hypothetical protein